MDALYGAVDAAVEPVPGWHPQLVDYEIRAVAYSDDGAGSRVVSTQLDRPD